MTCKACDLVVTEKFDCTIQVTGNCSFCKSPETYNAVCKYLGLLQVGGTLAHGYALKETYVCSHCGNMTRVAFTVCEDFVQAPVPKGQMKPLKEEKPSDKKSEEPTGTKYLTLDEMKKRLKHKPVPKPHGSV